MCGDRNGFGDIKPFMQWMGWGMPRHAAGDILISVIEGVLS